MERHTIFIGTKLDRVLTHRCSENAKTVSGSNENVIRARACRLDATSASCWIIGPVLGWMHRFEPRGESARDG